MYLSLQKAADTQKEQIKGLWIAGIKEVKIIAGISDLMETSKNQSRLILL